MEFIDIYDDLGQKAVKAKRKARHIEKRLSIEVSVCGL